MKIGSEVYIENDPSPAIGVIVDTPLDAAWAYMMKDVISWVKWPDIHKPTWILTKNLTKVMK